MPINNKQVEMLVVQKKKIISLCTIDTLFVFISLHYTYAAKLVICRIHIGFFIFSLFCELISSFLLGSAPAAKKLDVRPGKSSFPMTRKSLAARIGTEAPISEFYFCQSYQMHILLVSIIIQRAQAYFCTDFSYAPSVSMRTYLESMGM